jgi:dipeptidase D
VPASAGAEDAPVIVIQGHMDMVCEKTPESDHDFARDPIQLKYEDDWVTAEGTTLGADNGIALAVATVLAEDNASVHPPLELLFTVDEESGLIGAKTLDPDIFKGKILLNIDSEEEGEFTVGCAGGQDTRIRLPLEMSNLPAGFQQFDLAVHGLRGGHSGIDIHKHRASANKLLARALHAAHKAADMRIVSLRGGTVHNAIARDAIARIACDPDSSERLQSVFADVERILQSEYSDSEPSLALSFNRVEGGGASALSTEDTLKVVHLIVALPHGVAGMSADIEGLVETSNNLATVDLSDQGLSVLSSQRSSISSRMDEITARIKAIASLAGARISGENSYPPWQPDMDSFLLKRCQSVYVDLFNKEPLVRSIHAGLECGIIGSKTTGMDMISFGPTIRYPHSPEEKLYIPSIIRIWDFINQLLASYTK